MARDGPRIRPEYDTLVKSELLEVTMDYVEHPSHKLTLRGATGITAAREHSQRDRGLTTRSTSLVLHPLSLRLSELRQSSLVRIMKSAALIINSVFCCNVLS